ncbi:MAG: hypothetical protein CL746_00375 [Chloroflexi bacterium]|nr:hypothetical protein [Chloroflexota bacterium]|tara:strand:+ start:229 stop:1464 length:1236 start_codon:yes stop_codon:yes gene_type:complete
MLKFQNILRLPFMQLFFYREYRLFWIAAFFSNIGMWALIYGRLWLMRLMSDSEILLGLVSTANLTPVLLLSFFGGVIADKYNRLKVIRITRLLFCLITLLTGLLIYTDNITPIVLIIISVGTGILLAIDIPSRSSMIAKLVTKEFLAVGISMYSIVFGVSAIIGGSIFHPIVEMVGLEGLFIIIGISYFLTFLTLNRMIVNLHEPSNQENKKFFVDLFSGFKYLGKTPILLIITIIGFFIGLTSGSYDVLIPAVTTEILLGDSDTYGRILLIGGISGLISTSILIIIGQKINQFKSYFTFGIISSICLFFIGSDLGVSTIYILFGIISFSKVIFNTMGATIVQSNVKEEYRGRMMSINQLSWGSAAIGSILLGSIAEKISISFAFTFVGSVSFIIIFIGSILMMFRKIRTT